MTKRPFTYYMKVVYNLLLSQFLLLNSELSGDTVHFIYFNG